MFRNMRRFKQQISDEQCIQILKEQPRGVLSMLGDDDYPYGIPLDHWYCEKDGKLYFHCAKTGHKLDAVRKHDKVSYCVYDQGFRKEGEWALNIKAWWFSDELRLSPRRIKKEKSAQICAESLQTTKSTFKKNLTARFQEYAVLSLCRSI